MKLLAVKVQEEKRTPLPDADSLLLNVRLSVQLLTPDLSVTLAKQAVPFSSKMGRGAVATAGMNNENKTAVMGKIANGIALLEQGGNAAGKNVANCRVRLDFCGVRLSEISQILVIQGGFIECVNACPVCRSNVVRANFASLNSPRSFQQFKNKQCAPDGGDLFTCWDQSHTSPACDYCSLCGHQIAMYRSEVVTMFKATGGRIQDLNDPEKVCSSCAM